ncbi:AfsR/SARP family transcriptional regulator [Tropicibacter naphthalenivorans]|uniref:DNA-binding transcriptional activator of the SARP family protein n=1 Tax=Tropicibacter naphthalenivorans TaxID=441103 RepID=A0A0P1GFL1_9RHOB|nr:bacterial transcriptional activator domain-containing protein [Tropicibacter naphthalenivorans]CUH80591.1 DNA-binding transcriptional activator of the SARP family protein [Tropicibacter naphthalenivorans]SMC88934.1 Two-component response regulator, SAPR family, consists of REC, wHTH and BTAD domains [Tropicibacter naphthalenivorans]
MPPKLLRQGTVDEQLGFMLGRVVPDYAGGKFFKGVERQAARGASPDWLNRSRAAPTGSPRWHIHCLGQLTVFTGGNRPVDWQVSGAAPNKLRVLFAYLLHTGEKGAHSERISELLWPEGSFEKTKRAPLHHAIAMLRKALGSKDAVVRSGEYYRLNVPVGSWLDITSFEQICRRAISLARHGVPSDALPVYFAAERLYGGDLFEDLPLEYLHNEHEDRVLPRRTWLREMAMRVQYDMSALLRKEGRTAQALDRAQRAIALDPSSPEANIEAMRVLHAQGRLTAIHRQYRQFRAAVEAAGDLPERDEVHDIYEELCESLEGQRNSKVLAIR